ncbi:DUF4012 domain-containing protein [Candidatus Roizmanbacteria bacterium]|nr:DUF4012 domain-containing protein [Candidatus Roizmanbacteria bacterium]
MKHRRRRALFLLFLLVFGYFFIYKPYKIIKVRGSELEASAKKVKKAFSQNDIDLVEKELNDFSKTYKKLEREVRPLYLIAFVPYAADVINSVEAGHYTVEGAKEAVKAISPYADLIGFRKGQASFSEKSAEERLQTAVLTLDKIVDRIDPISQNFEQAEKRIKKINPNRYPKKIVGIVVRQRVENIKNQVLGVSTFFVDAKPLLQKLPDILGKDERKTYLVLFQNDKERRATGGFLTSYAVFTVDKGTIKKESSDDIYQLDNSISPHPKAPREILAYHKGVYNFYIRDSNLSPDFVESIKLFNTLYEKSSRKVKYDGIITLDSKVLADMLTIFGDTEAGGVVFSSKQDDRCDCPQVIYQLFDIVDRPVNYVKEDRKGILGRLLEALLLKVLGFSPSKYWGPFFANTYENLQTKHILLYFTDKNIQQSVEKLNLGGRIQDFDGDYLHVNNVNFAGAKSNLFVTETLESKTIVDTTGKIAREVIVNYRNPYPHSDCNLERGGLCLNAQLRNWIRVYVPKGAKLVEFKGSETDVNVYDDLGKTVYEGFLRVNPLGKAQVAVKYTLPETVSSKDYQLLIQNQPSADTQTLKVTVKGRKAYDDKFAKDFTLKQRL